MVSLSKEGEQLEQKALYVLAGYDDETEQYLSSLQNNLYKEGFVGIHTKNIPQHITLGSFPTDMENELICRLQNLAETQNFIEVSFNHIGIFNGGEVLFIEPDVTKSMLKLKEKFGDSCG